MFEQILFQFLFSTLAANNIEVHINTNNPGFEAQVQAPAKNPFLIAPLLSADAALAYDIDSKTILFQKNIHERRKIASISKLITAMIILDNHKLDEIVTVQKSGTEVEGSKIWLLPNEKITVENLLYAMLIDSANDAAKTLAEHDSLSEENFVKKMNAKAAKLELENTNFTNSTGLDAKNNYSSAYDILIFSLQALKYDFIKKAVQMQEKEISSADGKFKHKLKNTNELLKNNLFHVTGLKTGRTEGAGESLTALASLEKGHNILTVILGSADRFQETKILLDWISRTYIWE